MKLKSVLIGLLIALGIGYGADWGKNEPSWSYETLEIGLGYMHSIGDDVLAPKRNNGTFALRGDMWRRYWHIGFDGMFGTNSFNQISNTFSRKKDLVEVFGELHLKLGANIGSERVPLFIDLVGSILAGTNVGNVAGNAYGTSISGLGVELGGKIPLENHFFAYNLGYEYIAGGRYIIKSGNPSATINGGHLVRASIAYHKILTGNFSLYGRLSARYIMLNDSKQVMLNNGTGFSLPSANNLSAMFEVGFGF